MRLERFKIALPLVAALFSVGCVTVPKDAGFAKVRQTVLDRTGQVIRWNQGTSADRAADDAVKTLLSRELTVDGAVQVALLNNRSLQSSYEELGIAQAELVEAGLLQNPTFAAEVRFPKHAALPLEFDITQSFLNLFLMPLRRRLAGAEYEAARLRVTHEVLGMAAETKTAFVRAQAAAELVQMRRVAMEATGAAYDTARQLRDAGNISEFALNSERVFYEQAKVDLARAEADALDTREELNERMGVWGAQTQWTIAARLPELPADEVRSNGLESLAVSQRADLSAARQSVEAAGQSLGLTNSMALLGDLAVGGHYERDSDNTTTVGPNVTIPLPIFNQGQPAIAAAVARLRQSRDRYFALAVEVRAQVRRSRNKLLAARSLAEYQRHVLIPLRHEVVQLGILQVNAMQLGVFELLQAKQAEIDAGREYVEAMRDYWIARAELERAVGGRLPEDAPATQPTHQDPEEHKP